MDMLIQTPQASAGLGDPVSQIATRLQGFLTTDWKRQNTPHGLKAAWAKASASGGDATSTIFRDAGFKAWLAYFLATHEAGSHHKGKKIGDTLKCSLDNLPPGDLQEIARILKDTAAHPSVHTAIWKMSAQLQLRGEEGPPSCAPASTATSPTLIGTDIAQDTTQATIQASLATTYNTNSYYTSSPSEVANTNPLVALSSADEGQRFANASPYGMMAIFPPYFCGAIRMMGTEGATRAAVAMHFPYQQYGAIHCLMSLSIVPSRLPVVTKELFDVTLEIKGGMQYIINKGGATLLPMPSVTVQGASKDGIVSILGDEIDRGIEASPERKNELWQAIRHTSCATMTINNNPDDDGQLNLNLGLEEGLAIQRILYPKNKL